MIRNRIAAQLAAASAMALAIATPAQAGKADRALTQIGAAQAKVDTLNKMGAASELPATAAQAEEALKTAQEELKAGHKAAAIDNAIHSQSLADTAIGEMQKRQNQTNAAMQQSASDQVAAAREQAAVAGERASAAEQSAANSAAQASAARDAAMVATQSPPAQVETTVTTQQPTAAHHTTSTKVVHKAAKQAAPPAAVTTTTSVSTNQ